MSCTTSPPHASAIYLCPNAGKWAQHRVFFLLRSKNHLLPGSPWWVKIHQWNKMKTMFSTTLFSSKLCVQRPHSCPPSLLYGGFHSCGRLWGTSIAQVTTWLFFLYTMTSYSIQWPLFPKNNYLIAPRARPPFFKRLLLKTSVLIFWIIMMCYLVKISFHPKINS